MDVNGCQATVDGQEVSTYSESGVVLRKLYVCMLAMETLGPLLNTRDKMMELLWETTWTILYNPCLIIPTHTVSLRVAVHWNKHKL